jgi:hypothetical protein
MLLFRLLRHVDVRACTRVCGLTKKIRPRLRANHFCSYFKDVVFSVCDIQYIYI